MKAVNSIINCRTASMGGEIYYCENCQKEHFAFHSCKNRHCPKCGNEDSSKWLAKQMEKLLPVDYFLVTFTLPQELRFISSKNQILFYDALFSASSESLRTLLSDPKYAGGFSGFTGILHTWTRDMLYHPHVHYIVLGGAYDESRNQWNKANSKFLVSVMALSKIYRAKFRDFIKKKNSDLFDEIDKSIWLEKEFVTHSKNVGKGDKALEYLARYVYKTAITNNRIVSYDNNKKKVTIKYTDSNSGETRYVTMDTVEFIRRFLDHVLPNGFRKVRHFGFLNSRAIKTFEKLQNYFEIKTINKILVHNEKNPFIKREKDVCPHCNNKMKMIDLVPRKARSPSMLFENL